jgi:ribosome biogenesis protein UTP30
MKVSQKQPKKPTTSKQNVAKKIQTKEVQTPKKDIKDVETPKTKKDNKKEEETLKMDLVPTQKLSIFKPDLLLNAVTALLNYTQEKDSKNIFGDAGDIQLIFSLYTIPYKNRAKPFFIEIPHTLHDASTEICIFVKDPKKNYKELIEKTGIPNVKKVLGIESLRNKYDRHEARRKLLQSYDLFLCDDTLSLVLRRLLGKKFLNAKRFPLPIKFTDSLASSIVRARDSTYMYISTGSCVNVKIAKTSMSEKEICENITFSIEKIISKIPGQFKNIKSIHIKTKDSVSLPIYNNVPSMDQAVESTTSNDVPVEENAESD